jgi:hypothetical protein
MTLMAYMERCQEQLLLKCRAWVRSLHGTDTTFAAMHQLCGCTSNLQSWQLEGVAVVAAGGEALADQHGACWNG